MIVARRRDDRHATRLKLRDDVGDFSIFLRRHRQPQREDFDQRERELAGDLDERRVIGSGHVE